MATVQSKDVLRRGLESRVSNMFVGKTSGKVITCDGQEGVGVLVRAQGALPGSLLEVLNQTLEVLHALLRLRLDDHPGCPQVVDGGFKQCQEQTRSLGRAGRENAEDLMSRIFRIVGKRYIQLQMVQFTYSILFYRNKEAQSGKNKEHDIYCETHWLGFVCVFIESRSIERFSCITSFILQLNYPTIHPFHYLPSTE